MMKFKTTIREVKQGYQTVIPVGYCAMQNLLRFREPVAYTQGVNGWNSDIYEFGSIAISTGYRPFGTVNLTREQYQLIHDYERSAMNLTAKRDTNEQLKNQLEILTNDLILKLMDR